MNERITVAMIIQGYHPRIGGAERQLRALAPLLQSRGVDLHILTRRYPGLASYEMVDGVPVHRLPIPGPKPLASLSFTLSALRLLRRLRPAVIHAHEILSPATTAVLAKRLLGTPVCVKLLRGGALGDLTRLRQRPLGARRLALFRRQVDTFIAISREIEAELVDRGIPAERRAFIPNGIDTQHFLPLSQQEKQALRARLDLPISAPVAVFTGRLAPEKRLDRLIKLWPEVRARHPQAILLLVGSGPQEQKLRALAGDGVRFTGASEDVLPFLQVADLFVLPSTAEGLSNALLEALATGLPAVVSQVGGAADVIEHGYSGWLVPPEDGVALRNGLMALFYNPELRAEMGRNGRRRVAQDYALPMIADRLRALYDRLCTQRIAHSTSPQEVGRP